MRRERRTKAPSTQEIERARVNARHYLDLIGANEAAAQAADSQHDPSGLQESKDAFFRDLEACLNAGRTARNYLYAAAETSDARRWLDERLAPPLFKFHADVAGTDFHDRAIGLSNTFGVNIEIGKGTAQFQIVSMPDGALGTKALTENVRAQPRRFVYNKLDLGSSLAGELDNISSKPEPIIVLLERFVIGLEQILKNAKRNSRF